jgi:hypothetical protein
MIKNKYLLALLGVLAATGITFAAETVVENGNSQIYAANSTSSYTEATITFGSNISDYNDYPIDASNFEEYKYSSLTDISYSNMIISMDNCYKKYSCRTFWGIEYNYKKNNNSLQIGHNINYGTSAGSLTINLNGYKYQSVSIYADTYYKETFDLKAFKYKVTYAVDIPFSINGESKINNGSWNKNTETETVSQKTDLDGNVIVPQYDLYYCTNPQTSLTISVPGTSEQYDMIYITKIVFHLV